VVNGVIVQSDPTGLPLVVRTDLKWGRPINVDGVRSYIPTFSSCPSNTCRAEMLECKT